MSGQCNLIHRTGGGGQPADSELGWGEGVDAWGCIYFQDSLKVNCYYYPSLSPFLMVLIYWSGILK